MSARTLLIMVAGWLVLSLGAGAGCMKWQWNYFVERPTVFDEVREMKSVDAVGYFIGDWFENTTSLKDHLSEQLRGDELYHDPYYHLNVRPLMAARDSGIDALAAPEMPAERVDAVLQEFLRRDLAVESSRGYHSNAELHGVVMSFVSRAGEPRTLLVARGGQVSNDHYPFYEALFDDKMNLVRSHMFYFDVAGLEGPDGWPTLLMVSFLMGLLIMFIVSLVTVVYWLGVIVRNIIGRRRGAVDG